MKQSLKNLSLVLVFCMMAAFIPLTGGGLTVYADGDFTIEDGVLTKYNGLGGDVVIPDGVTEIGEGAFGLCSGMTSVTIPDSVTRISGSAFAACSSLTSVTIPDSVTCINHYAFSGCTALTTIHLSGSVSFFGSFWASGCPSLTSVQVDESSQYLCSVDGVLYNKDKTRLILYPQGKSATHFSVPSGVKTLYDCCIRECPALQSVTLPDSVTFIGNYVFSRCPSLKSVNIPDRVYVIGTDSFCQNPLLSEVTIPGSMRQISYNAFSDCASLTTVTILVKSTDIKNGAFSNSNVSTVNYVGTRDDWNSSGWKYCFGSNITVNDNYYPLLVTRQPVSQSIVAGRPVTLSVEATGNSLQYQWHFRKKGQTSFSIWNGHTNATETVTPNSTWDGIQLYCRIADASGKTVDSDTVTVSVLSIASHPKNVTVEDEKNATFTVKATGSDLKYQWQYKKGRPRGATGTEEPPLPPPQQPIPHGRECRCAAWSPTAQAIP